MTNRRIKEMMQNIDPKYQQKADARAAAVTHTARHSRVPSLLVCGAAACCAVFAAAIIVPKLKTQQIETAMSESQNDSAEQSEYELVSKVEVQVDPTLQHNFAEDEVRLMAPAYAPYMLELSAEQQEEFASSLTIHYAAACAIADLDGTGMKPCDPDMPFPDGETYSVFVYNSGDPYRLTAYPDNTVVVERNGEEVRWQLGEGIYDLFAKYANQEQTDGHLTWVDPDSVNAVDIWKNTNVAAKECDMTTKDGVFYKVRNNMDYYNRASGVTVSATKSDSIHPFIADRSTFCMDLNAGKVSEYLDYFYSDDAEKLMNGCEGIAQDENGTFTTAKDGEKTYSATEYNHRCSVMPGGTHRIDCPPVENDDCKPEQMEFDDFDFYNSRRQILDGMALNSFEFSKMILGYLYEFDKWDIVGTEEVNGRTCVHIKGTASDKFIFHEFVKDFDMYVDEATGVIVKVLGYNTNGDLTHFVNTLNLKFEDEAEPFELPDFSGYEIYEMSEPYYVAQPAVADGAPFTDPATDTPEQ